jgi:hypothetical protein
MIDYIDVDVAYVLGLIVARGEIVETGTLKQIVIEFPYRNLEAVGVEKKVDQRDKLLISINKIRDRIQELENIEIRVEEREHAIYLIMESPKETIFIRNIKRLLRGKTSHYEFEIPPEIFQSDESIKKEFIRGYADVAGSARTSNKDKQGRHRVYLDVLNKNWKLPIQLCHLLQDHLGIPVNTITWGHPNIRDPNLEDYKKGHTTAWAREHQVKVYADEFIKIGFYVEHKQEILQELAEYNKNQRFPKAKFCNPCKITLRKKKPSHPEENSQLLPTELRGQHFDSYKQICIALGCYRYSRCKETNLERFLKPM